MYGFRRSHQSMPTFHRWQVIFASDGAMLVCRTISNRVSPGGRLGQFEIAAIDWLFARRNCCHGLLIGFGDFDYLRSRNVRPPPFVVQAASEGKDGTSRLVQRRRRRGLRAGCRGAFSIVTTSQRQVAMK